MHRLHQDERVREELLLDLDEIARQGAKRMLAEALEAEVEAYLEAARAERDEQGRAPWSFAMATPGSVRSSWEPEPSRFALRGSTTVGWTKTATARGSKA